MKIDRVGEVNRANNGMLMKIVAYRSCKSIDVQFENGVTVYNKVYWDFKRGVLGLPRRDRTGEVRRSNNGRLMKVVAYRSSKDIDIQFEDGTLVCNKTYNNFRTGKINNPSIYFSREGEVNRANNGLLMKIIAYRNNQDIDIQFEDGTVVKNRLYGAFKKGEILHPMISKMVCKSVSHKNFYGFTNIRKSFEYNGMVYYLCKDLQGKGQVYTLQKMMELAGVKPTF